jgi:hypothetical protein
MTGDSLNNARREASRHFRNKTMEHLKGRMSGVAVNGKNKNSRDL